MAVRHLEVSTVLDLGAGRPHRGVRLQLAADHLTLREIIARTVAAELAERKSRRRSEIAGFLIALTGAGEGADAVLERLGEPQLEAEVARAVEAFGAGRYSVVIDGEAVADLDTPVALTLRSRVIFVRRVGLRSG